MGGGRGAAGLPAGARQTRRRRRQAGRARPYRSSRDTTPNRSRRANGASRTAFRGATSFCFPVTAAPANAFCCCNSPPRMCSARTGCARCPRRDRCCSSIARTTRASLCAACSRSSSTTARAMPMLRRICMFSRWWIATTRRANCWRPWGATGSCGRRRSMTRCWRRRARCKPICIVIDNVADVFGGNEINRIQVRQFVTPDAPPRARRERLRDHVGASERRRASRTSPG